MASNLWIDRTRRMREEPGSPELPEPSTSGEPRATREAAGTLISRLSPQERAAVVLKEVFDLTLEEQKLILSRVGPGRPLPPRRKRRANKVD